MAQVVPRRAGAGGPALVRMLARLAESEVPEDGPSLPDRLSLWLGWTDAVALSAVLDRAAPAAVAEARADGDAHRRECARVRAVLAKAIVGGQPARGQAGPASAAARVAAETADFTLHRQRLLSYQRSMETAIGNLRARLRAALAAQRPDLLRLAAADAVMEQALGPRERRLLAAVPGVLEGRFERLRRAAGDALPPDDEPRAPAPAWLEVFRSEVRDVLLAELDLRFQPVEGLLAALNARPAAREAAGAASL